MKARVQFFACGHDFLIFEHTDAIILLPLQEFYEPVATAFGFEHPGARGGRSRRRAQGVPQPGVFFELVERNATSRNEQVRQRISQKIPIAMVVSPVSCPMARLNRSLMPDARAAKKPNATAYAAMLVAVPSANSSR